jgi:GntR family transcriptional regulator/MocR family aminotransferase
VVRMKGETEETCGVVEQLAMAEFIESGAYDRHIRTMRAEYRRRREQFVAAVSASSSTTAVGGMPAGLHVTLEHLGAAPSRQAWRRLGLESLDLYRHPESGSERAGLVVGFAAPSPSAWSSALDALIRLLP